MSTNWSERQVVKLIRYTKAKISSNGTKSLRRALIESEASEFKWVTEDADNAVFKTTEWEGLCYYNGENQSPSLSPLEFEEQEQKSGKDDIAIIADELSLFVKLLRDANPYLSEDAIIRLAIAGHITHNKRG